MDLLNKMATFVRIVESGSLAAAAKQLRISAAAVSRQLATLEAELDVVLVTRTTRRMALTDAGRRYYERCTRILRDVDDAQSLGAHELEGPLKITAPVTFGMAAIVPLLHGLMKKHPALVVELNLEDRFVDLVPEGFDVAVRVGTTPPESTEIIGALLLTYGRVLVAAPSYLKKRGVPTQPEALAKHDALVPWVGPSDTWTLHDSIREARVRPKVMFRSNALHALLELAVAGAGVALLPEWFVRDPIAARELRVVLPAWNPARTVATAIYPRQHRGAPRVRALIEHLREGLGALGASSQP